MLNVLIIKISSMGDLIHTLPALTDAKQALGEITFDWVAAPAFAEIPRWHTAVNHVIACPFRQWKKRYFQAWRQGEIKKFTHALREKHYDLIIDAQSALKSALISKIAHGKNAGMDKNSVCEFGAQYFYKNSYFVEKNQHALTRTRQLFAHALNYSLPSSTPDFGIDVAKLPTLMMTLPKNFIVIIPNTTWPTKHWLDAHWQQLMMKINHAGFSVVIPWGNPTEKQRAEMLKNAGENVTVLPKISLSECASLLMHAKAAVCVDTGLGHLAAALQTPPIHLYGPTDPQKIGAYGEQQRHLQSTIPCAQKCKRTCYSTKMPSPQAACLSQITPENVWEALQNRLSRVTRLAADT